MMENYCLQQFTYGTAEPLNQDLYFSCVLFLHFICFYIRNLDCSISHLFDIVTKELSKIRSRILSCCHLELDSVDVMPLLLFYHTPSVLRGITTRFHLDVGTFCPC